MKYILPLSFKYVLKCLAGGSLRYEVFLVSKKIVLQEPSGYLFNMNFRRTFFVQ